ncbi:isochorismatase family protein [Streptomyces sp. ISL-22]|uniref:isochorismatase family protein n=1 Tax=unclassified Streptomyces TaxID=2593676 RepID=UPI001BEC69C9|nr:MULTISPECIES: isochorismatase family protein [unclassified Streptomyces]MBT2417082.1 isochorismatase family protein [Streptomyces sp. ISL-24]MBT2436066.1 isochorismatase family protein [Streptomyces sp. ISL-22]
MTPGSIFPYVMPTPAMLPDDRTGWTLDPSRSALVVLNLQRRFLRVLDQEGAPVAELLANAGRLVRAAHAAGVPVVHTVPAGERVPAAYGRPAGPPADKDGEAFAEQVAPRSGDVVLTARKHSAFARTRLESRLRDLKRDQVVLVGLFARIGVLMTAADAWVRDLEPFVVADAIADVSAGSHEFALEWMADTCGAVTSTDLVVAAFDPAVPAAKAV